MLHIALRILGLEVWSLDVSTEDQDEDDLPHADQLTTDVGFVPDKPERDGQADTYVFRP